MDKQKKFGFLKLRQKALSIMVASLGILTTSHAQTPIKSDVLSDRNNEIDYEGWEKKPPKARLVLKLNPNFPEDMLLAGHSSHSSHVSHSSHSSHYSSSSGYSSGSSNGDSGGSALPLVVVGGALAVGGYLLGKNKEDKKK